MSRSVFVSHAVKDRELAAQVVALLEEGMGVPEDEIFCTSLKGHDIPAGENFVSYIKSQMQGPKVVILLLTPAYFESKFCISELGAAWVKSHAIFPILVPPLDYADIKDVLLGTQVVKIDDDISYNQLRELLQKEITFTPKSQTKWDVKRRSFLKDIKPILADMPGPSMVSASALEAKDRQLEEARVELDEYEETVQSLKKRLAAVEALKDKAAVAEVSKQFDDTGLTEQLDERTNEIAEYRSTLRGTEMLKYALSAFYGKPYKINRFEDREVFDEAARFGFINGDDEPVWSQRHMKSLRAKLKELGSFISENEGDLGKQVDEDVPLEPENQDFWEYHYNI